MPYLFKTPVFQIPFMGSGDLMTADEERIVHMIIENQIRAGILGAGGTRVYKEGTWDSPIVNGDGTVDVRLSGAPAVQGIVNDGLVEVVGSVEWTGLLPDSFYYLYIQSDSNTYIDPAVITPIASLTPITSPDHLYFATLDTTGSGNPVPTAPILNTQPTGKPTAFNLFSILNNNTDPFGPVLNQTILTVLQQFTVRVGQADTALFQQFNPDAVLPVISIENAGSMPEVASSGELRLADGRVVAGLALSDPANGAFQGSALSLIGALNEILASLLAHVNQDTDPHGATLYQTNLTLSGGLTTNRILLHRAPPAPPAPPGSPPAPPICDIQSSTEISFCDIRSHLQLSDQDNPAYLGDAVSLVGALNELLGLIDTIATTLDASLGSRTPAVSPVVFEIIPEEVGQSLHFRITFFDADSLPADPGSVGQVSPPGSPPVFYWQQVHSRVSSTGWYYEQYNLPPPLPPAPPIPVGSLPGAVLVPAPVPVPAWVALPADGLPADLQVRPDGTPVKVSYRPQAGDHLFLRHRYSVSIQQDNGELGEHEFGTVCFG